MEKVIYERLYPEEGTSGPSILRKVEHEGVSSEILIMIWEAW